MSNINEFRKLGAVAQAYKDMLEARSVKEEVCPKCGQEPCVCDQEIPEELSKEDASDFVVAASAAKKAGKKKFKFGDKEYPVTIKTDVKTEEFQTCEGCKTESTCMKESSCSTKEEKEVDNAKKGDVEINPEEKLETDATKAQ